MTPNVKVLKGKDDEDIDYLAVLRQWVRERLQEDVVDEDALTDKLIGTFGKREGFWEGLLAQHLRHIVRDLVRDVVGSSRHNATSSNVVSFRDGKTMTRKELTERSLVSKPFAQWRERTGVGVTVRLTAMTKTDIKAAVELRTEYSERNLRVVRWLEVLAEKLKDGQKVEDVWTLEEIAEKWEEVNGEKVGG